jgi:hypothetical protein
MKKLITFFILISFFQANAQTIYVSKIRGNDAWPGSNTQPVATINRGVQICPAGGIVSIESDSSTGDYQESGDIVVPRSMTIQNRFPLPGGQVNINAGNRPVGTQFKSIFKIQNISAVTIQGIRMRNLIGNGSNAVYITQFASNIQILDCGFENIGWVSNDLITESNGTTSVSAIKVEAYSPTAMSNVRISRNTISNCATGRGEAITITGNVDGFTVDSNTVHHISNIGIDAAGGWQIAGLPITTTYRARNGKIIGNTVYNCMSPTAVSAGIYLDGSYTCLVEGNTVYNSGAGISIGAEQPIGATNPGGHTVRNNLIYSNSTGGMIIGTAQNGKSITDVKIISNTFFKNRNGLPVNGVTTIGGIALSDSLNGSAPANIFGGEISFQNADAINLRNNNIYRRINRRAWYIQPNFRLLNFSAAYNNYYQDFITSVPLISIDGAFLNGNTQVSASYASLATFTATWPSLEQNTTDIDPVFVDTTNRNLKLAASSPLINKGDPSTTNALAGLLDLAGISRIICNRIDIGAYEFNAPTPATPVISPAGTINACSAQVQLSSSAASGNQWYVGGNPINGATGSTYSATQNGSYTVVVTNSGCSSVTSTATILNITNPPSAPAISASGSTTFCSGGSVILTSNSATGNHWFLNGSPIAGATNSTYTANSTGNYTTTRTISGCISAPSNTISVVVNQTPNAPNVTANGNPTFCSGGSLLLNSNTPPGSQCQWYQNGTIIPGANGVNYLVTSAGNYSVTVTVNGCTSVQSLALTITITPSPTTPAITASGNTSFCTGGNVTLISNAASGNQWYLNGSVILGATNLSYTAIVTGNYTVTSTANGCTSPQSVPVMVTVNPIPATPTIVANGNTTFCSGGGVTLSSNAGNGNQWFQNNIPVTGATSNNFTATTTGLYTVRVTQNGCTSGISNNISVTVNSIPPVPVITRNGSTFTTQGGYNSYKWYYNNVEIIGATTNSYTPTQSGKYKVEVFDTKDCSNISADVNINLTGLGIVTVDSTTIKLLPNPADKFIKVIASNNSGTFDLLYSIFNSSGQLLVSGSVKNPVTTIRTDYLQNGDYFIRFNNSASLKFIILH